MATDTKPIPPTTKGVASLGKTLVGIWQKTKGGVGVKCCPGCGDASGHPYS
jgi:hypothetical protein